MVDFPVQFNFGTTEVTQESRVYINLVGQMLQRDPSLNLQIEGHTDASGNAKANMMLSWERAFAIFRTLVDQYGIDPSRLRPVGKGATEPLPNAVPTDAENRRVQFRVFG
jgi:outer membrane protein OmpA-like peptidoglycan-associated protein